MVSSDVSKNGDALIRRKRFDMIYGLGRNPKLVVLNDCEGGEMVHHQVASAEAAR
jgi:hypothetical protein